MELSMLRHPTLTAALDRVVLVAGAMLGVAGCGEITSINWPSDSRCRFEGTCDIGPPPVTVAFAVSPDSVHILRGDTVSLYAWSCGGSILVCGISGDIRSNWRIAGLAAAAVTSTGTRTNRVDSATTIVVRGLHSGNAAVHAVSASDSTLSKTVRVHVVDSSEVTDLDVFFDFDPQKMRAGSGGGTVTARLRDAAGNIILSRATRWWVSDSTVLEVRPIMNPLDRRDRYSFIPKKAGSVYVDATFHGLRVPMMWTVAP
jgi:hypothetical protein